MLIECSNIKKSFQGIDLLKDISFKVDDHDKIAIIGVNGAGKTTILNMSDGCFSSICKCKTLWTSFIPY